ncbi:MAG: hypothetical protein HY270_20940 [Deltaproteobacteria bacterium]|nr:hypothetical protein [Deltaproteobacteria bacterium]
MTTSARIRTWGTTGCAMVMLALVAAPVPAQTCTGSAPGNDCIPGGVGK